MTAVRQQGSRIQRPPAARFVRIDLGDLERWGIAAAAIISVLDFLDRREEEEGTPLASAAELTDALAGIAGRRSVDAALASLEAAGVVRRVREMKVGDRNLVHSVRFALCAVRLSEISQGLADAEPEAAEEGDPENAKTHAPGSAIKQPPSKTQKSFFLNRENKEKENNNNPRAREMVVEFSDTSSLGGVPEAWCELLRHETEEQKTTATKAAFAAGILRRWLMAGKPSRSRPKPSYEPPVIPAQPATLETPSRAVATAARKTWPSHLTEARVAMGRVGPSGRAGAS